MSHRLKIVSGMNIADKLNPQDGRFGFTYGQPQIDFRVACLPTVHGENIVIRILDKSRASMTLERLGLSDHNLKLLESLIKRPEGIIIVTGPTGSGKTTTLYAVLNQINSLERNIMTLEDPVEYELPLMRQGAGPRRHGDEFRRRRPRACCARTPMSSSSARCATRRRRRWLCAPR